ncbi:MAG: lycopene cyclase domain-containing protein [Saprospiraceae bacterium]
MPDSYLYLAVDLLSFVFPFLFSFERKWIHFIGQWKAILSGLCVMFLFFIIWDVLFTRWGVWGFNDRYILGIKKLGLPLEEYLFFLLIGFCCMFLYVSMNHLLADFQKKWKETWFKNIFIGLAILDLVVAIYYSSRLYTLSALGLNALAIFAIVYYCKWFSWKKFCIGYLFSFIPFTLVNGILTGGFTPEPVVWYNDLQNTGIRLNSIPIEDSQYMMLMMIMSIFVFEWFQIKKFRNNRTR